MYKIRPQKINILFNFAALFIFIGAVVCNADTFTNEDLFKILNKNPNTNAPVNNIAELIPLLPLELRQNFTFVFDSRSPLKESISPSYPRVILFSDDARFMMTFTGHPGKPGADVIETMTYNEKNAAFEMYARKLPAAVSRGETFSTDTKTCMKCHGEDARPIFDSYPLWPGFYGSIRDTFFEDSALTRTEKKNFLSFKGHQGKTGVYKDLIYLRATDVAPFLEPSKIKRQENVADINVLESLPNTRLGMALTELNRKRIYRKLVKALSTEKKKTYLSELLDCGPSRVSRADVKKIAAMMQIENTDRLKRLGIKDDDPVRKISHMEELTFVRELAQFDWVTKDAGVSRDDWSMALESNSLSYFDGILSGEHNGKSFYGKEDLIFELLKDLSETDQSYKKFFNTRGPYKGHRFGLRLNISSALESCPLLITSNR